jgi:hypothetical protein
VPLRERVKTLCATAERDASADVEHADAIGRRLLEQGRPLLGQIDCLLPKGDAARDGAHDEVALRVLQCAINYGNKTDDWPPCLALMEQSLQLAASQTTIARINDNLVIVRGNIKLNQCFFCEKNAKDEKFKLSVTMHGNVKTQYVAYNTTRTTWSHNTFTVPRCAACAAAHKAAGEANGAGILFGVLTAAVYLLSLSKTGDLVSVGFGPLLFIVGIIVTIVVSAMAARAVAYMRLGGTRPLNNQYEHPTITQKKKEGWVFGQSPATKAQHSSSGPAKENRFARWEFFRSKVRSGAPASLMVMAVWLVAMVCTWPLSLLPALVSNGPDSLLARYDVGMISRNQLIGDMLDLSTTTPISSDVRNRFGAILGSGENAQITWLPALTRAAGSDSAFRALAIDNLGALGPKAIGAEGVLKQAVTSGDSVISGLATAAIAKIDPASAVDGLLNDLTAKDWRVRQRAAIALGGFGPAAQSAVPALKRATKDTDIDVRTAATAALSKIQ